MEASNYRQVVELVDAALDLEPLARKAFLDSECAGRPQLRSEVDSLLAEENELADQFLAAPAALEIVELLADSAMGDQAPPTAAAPTSVGPYRVLRELGRGGMGTVYLAEQREPIERRVALKVLHGLDGERGARRFATECRALARLKHPNIAAVYDAGVSDDRRAFVAMEWVEGAHITEWCDQNQLPMADRIQLFLSVCAGVSHAHQKGLVHRDLKPSNVLVADVDGQATAKVIDFGIARSLDETDSSISVTSPAAESEALGHAVEHSRSFLMGSPIYMSPEAAALSGRSDVDTRTDVYSLGILLYELLIGKPPFETLGLGIGGMLHQVRTADSPTLSRRWADLAPDQQVQLAALRGVGAKRLAGSLRGDLDAILAKATARDRDHRYGAVSELVADLTRHLEHRPVEARASSLGYNLSRYLRRNAGAVTAVALVIGVLVAGIAARTQEAKRANTEAQRANLEAQRAGQALAEAEQLSDFLIGLLEIVDPNRGLDDPESVDELLAKAETTMDEELAEQPLARARFLQTLGRIAMSRTQLERASSLYEQALALREKHQASDHPDLITTVGSLGVIYRRQGREAEAESLLVRALELLETGDEPDPGQHAATLTWLANLHYQQKRYQDAIAGHRRALEIRRQEVPENTGAIGESLNNLSVALRDLGRFSEAKPVLKEAERYFSRAFGPKHTFTITCWLNMAGIEEQLGQWDEAENLLRQSAEIWQEAHGPFHHRTLLARRALGSLWVRRQWADKAEAHLSKMLEQQQAGDSGKRIEVARTQSVLGSALSLQGNQDAAEVQFRQALATYSEVLGDDHYSTDNLRARLAWVAWKRGQHTPAAATLEALLTKREKALGPDHRGIAFLSQILGQVLLEAGRLDEAEPAFSRSLKIHEAASSGPSVQVARDLFGLGSIQRLKGKNHEASRLLSRSLEIFQQVLPADHPDLLAAQDEKAALN